MATVAVYFFSIFVSVFGFLSMIMGLFAPVMTFLAYVDLKNGRQYPWVVHLAGFFGIFTFVAVIGIMFGDMKPEEMTIYIQAPALVGVFTMWLSSLYLLITQKM